MNKDIDLNPKSDAEIRRMYLDECTQAWGAILKRLWVVFSQVPTPGQFEIYRHDLGGIPMELLDQAITRCLQEHRFKSVPTIGDVWAALRKVMHLNDQADIEIEVKYWIARRDVLLENSMQRFANGISAYAHLSPADDDAEVTQPAEVAA